MYIVDVSPKTCHVPNNLSLNVAQLMFLVSGDTEFGKQKMDDNFFGT